MDNRPHILVTGANGFVGSRLCRELEARSIQVNAAMRRKIRDSDYEVGTITATTDWSQALSDCSAVIHLAARVHVMNDQVQDPLVAFREMNVDATLNLARQAFDHGLKRFVFVSSVKVNGESTTGRSPYSSADAPAPLDAYGQSKSEAELALLDLARTTGLEVVIVRPPLVYGPGVGANFLRLMQLVKLGLPLPLGCIRNRRSLVSLDNLVDLLVTCIDHPAAAGQTFLLSDDDDISTSDLIRMLATSMGKRALLLPVSEKILSAGAAMMGQSAAASRLLDSLQVDIEFTKSALDWRPVVGMQDAIDATVAHFLAHS